MSVEGLPESVTDVILRVARADGHELDAVLSPAQPSRVLKLVGPAGIAIPGYLRLGIEHILTGANHLMFVLGLLLLIGPNWGIVKAISAVSATVARLAPTYVISGFAAYGLIDRLVTVYI